MYGVHEIPTFTQEWADRTLGGRSDRKIAHNTILHTWHSPINGPTVYSVRYHSTDILTMISGVIFVNTGGYHTVTTIVRLNAMLRGHGLNIGSVKGVTSYSGYVRGEYRTIHPLRDREAIDTVSGHFFPDASHARTGVKANGLTADRFASVEGAL